MGVATFGAGCFWGAEAAFRGIEGVIATTVGFASSSDFDPEEAEACANGPADAEVVRVEYDPAEISYESLLDAFWDMHDPTLTNGVEPRVCDQTRSTVLYHDEAQRAAAERSLSALERSGQHERPILTEIAPAGPFLMAADHHQRYLEKQAGAF